MASRLPLAEVSKNKEKVISLCRESSDFMINFLSDFLQNSNPGRVELCFTKADVTVENDLINASKNIERLDVLVCNAGIMGARGG